MLNASSHIHLIGIGGTGLSAIARVLLESGYTVSGSDRAASPLAESIRKAGAIVSIGHRPENIKGADVVVRSSAVQDDNPEVKAARALGIPVLKRADFLGELMAGRDGIAVAGTHGKTTTTAMIAYTLSQIGQDPSYIVGGIVKDLGQNAHAGHGSAFVIEADEYDRMFLGLRPRIAVITSVEHDHPDCFPTPADYRQAFLDFASRLEPGGSLLVCMQDAGASELARELSERGARPFTYGFQISGADYTASALEQNAHGGFSFRAWFRDGQENRLAKVSLRVPGRHNVLNALAALAVCHRLGLPLDEAARALGRFSGTGRRFDVRGEAGGVIVVDDYAHHPTAVRATLAAARARYPGQRIWAVLQPHTYSRTRSLLHEFAAAFEDADQVLVTEVYAAREQSDGFSARAVVDAMQHPNARFTGGLNETADLLLEELKPGDVLLVLSAGDADQISARVLMGLRERKEDHA